MAIPMTAIIALAAAALAAVILFALFHKRLSAFESEISDRLHRLEHDVTGSVAGVSEKIAVIHHEVAKQAFAQATARAAQTAEAARS